MRSRAAELRVGIALLGLLAAPLPAAAQRVIDLGADTIKWSHRERPGDVEVRIHTRGDTAIIVRRGFGFDSLHTVHESDIVRTGENIIIDAAQVVGGDVVAIGGSVTVYGRVRGDAVAIGGDVSVKSGGSIHGDAVAIGGRVNREADAYIGGQNVGMGFIPAGIFAPRGLTHGPVAILRGISFLILVVFVLKMAFVLLVGWVASAVARPSMEQFGRTASEGPWSSLFAGLGAHFAFAILAVLLGITVIGLVVVIPAGVAMVPLNAMGLALMAALLGQRVGRGKTEAISAPRPWTAAAAIGLGLLSLPMVLGLLLLGIGGLGSVVALVVLLFGGTVLSLAAATGFGAMVLTVLRTRHSSATPPAGSMSAPPPTPPQAPLPPAPATWSPGS